MPGWRDVLAEHGVVGSAHDVVRRKYLAQLADLTGRNTILYYSGWLAKTTLVGQYPELFSVNDTDKNGFMAAIHKLDRKRGLDLVLHTPGGSIAAAESLVEYLHAMFGHNIRAIVPQLAMSAGTMIACAAEEIVMGEHSSIGPIDPQLNGLPAHGVVEEFQRAAEEIREDPAKIPLWQPIIAKYHPTLIGACVNSINWSEQIVKAWLASGMFRGDADAADRAEKVVTDLGRPNATLSHGRHIGIEAAKRAGLKVLRLEDDQELQEAVLTVHHACVQTLTDTATVKLIENQDGVAFVQNMNVLAPMPFAPGSMPGMGLAVPFAPPGPAQTPPGNGDPGQSPPDE
jgi:hypothetical protein